MRPPPKLTISEWADRFRKLSSEDSAEPGQWRTDRVPWQREIMDAISDPTVREVWFMKSAQVGATQILGNVIGFYVHQDPAPVMLVQPTLEVAEGWSKQRLAPMIRDTPVLTELIGDARSRDSGNTLLEKSFPGGTLKIAGANSPASLRSRPIRVVLCDEVDAYPMSAGPEGDPIALAKKRSTAFWNRKFVAVSTPTIKGQSRIERGFMSGDQRYCYVPCLACGAMQRLVWTQLRWDDDRPDSARYACVECGYEHGEHEKLTMLQHRQWRATEPFRGVASFHVSELYSPLSTWAEMVDAFLKAKGQPETLQTFVNTALGESWADTSEAVKADSLVGRREPYTPDRVPAGVAMLVLGVDTQDDRLEASVWGLGRDEEAWLIEHQVLRGDPGSEAVWHDLDRFRLLPRRTEDGRSLLIEATAVDSGGHFTQHVYAYCARRKAQRVWAVKGADGQGRLIWPRKASRSAKHRADVYVIGVDTAKDLLYGRLKRVHEPGAGYLHFPLSVDEGYFAQLTAETVVYQTVKGRRVRGYRPKTAGARTEALDCLVYAYAAFVGRGGPRLVQFAPSVERATAVEPEVVAAEAPPPAAPTPAPPPVRRRESNWLGDRTRNWLR